MDYEPTVLGGRVQAIDAVCAWLGSEAAVSDGEAMLQALLARGLIVRGPRGFVTTHELDHLTESEWCELIDEILG
ncbi:MAG: hypothetical protein KatS3mg109_1322 [Pirellulaceae bacterium]|nr:MAG: hypothetical protein KatS3mg109_1322 [Pirellulaceae bacterium]